MSISARNWAWDVGTVTLDGVTRPMHPGEKLTLLCLAELENCDDGYAYPSQEYIRERTMLNERTIRRHVKMLVEVKAVEVSKRRHRNGKWTHSVYILNVPKSYRLRDKEWIAKQGADTVSFGAVA